METAAVVGVDTFFSLIFGAYDVTVRIAGVIDLTLLRSYIEFSDFEGY